VTQPGKVSFFNEGDVISPETVGQNSGKNGVVLVRRLSWDLIGNLDSPIELIVESGASRCVWGRLFAVVERVIIREQINFQNVKAIEFRKKVSRGIRDSLKNDEKFPTLLPDKSILANANIPKRSQ